MSSLPPEVWRTMEEVDGGFEGFFWSDPPEYNLHRIHANKAFRPLSRASPRASSSSSTRRSTGAPAPVRWT